MGKLGAAVGLVCLAQGALAECAPGVVELRSLSGMVTRISAEVADDPGERSQGLMNRPKMASSAGMLFVYPQPQHAFFWMKNTLIPLDMLFADASGRVLKVHNNAKPLDETSIDGGPGVTYVLEINGGLAARLGVGPGAVMRSDVMDQPGAAWPCAPQ